MFRRWGSFTASVLAALALLSSCASEQYTYLPAGLSGKTTDRAKKGKAYYEVPPGAPTGTVRIRSGGVVKLKPTGGGSRIPALHVRMAIVNQSSQAPWSVDPHAQTVSFPNDGSNIAPVFVQPQSPATPELIVNQGDIRTLDLYFALPDGEKSAKELPEFNFQWRVQAGTQLVQETTSFDRVAIPPAYDYGPYPYYPYDMGWGPDWGWGMGWGPGWGWGPGFWGGPGYFGGAAAPPPNRPVIVGH